MSRSLRPESVFAPSPEPKAAAELNAEQEAEMARACPATFLGIADDGRRLNIALGHGTERVTRFFTQAELRRRETLEALLGVEWLRKTFPRYEMLDCPEGVSLVTTDYDDFIAFDWILDRCFEAAGFTPPSELG